MEGIPKERHGFRSSSSERPRAGSAFTSHRDQSKRKFVHLTLGVAFNQKVVCFEVAGSLLRRDWTGAERGKGCKQRALARLH